MSRGSRAVVALICFFTALNYPSTTIGALLSSATVELGTDYGEAACSACKKNGPIGAFDSKVALSFDKTFSSQRDVTNVMETRYGSVLGVQLNTALVKYAGKKIHPYGLFYIKNKEYGSFEAAYYHGGLSSKFGINTKSLMTAIGNINSNSPYWVQYVLDTYKTRKNCSKCNPMPPISFAPGLWSTQLNSSNGREINTTNFTYIPKKLGPFYTGISYTPGSHHMLSTGLYYAEHVNSMILKTSIIGEFNIASTSKKITTPHHSIEAGLNISYLGIIGGMSIGKTVSLYTYESTIQKMNNLFKSIGLGYSIGPFGIYITNFNSRAHHKNYVNTIPSQVAFRHTSAGLSYKSRGNIINFLEVSSFNFAPNNRILDDARQTISSTKQAKGMLYMVGTRTKF